MICLGCGYSLDGLAGHQCPECGRRFDPARRDSFGPPLRGTLAAKQVRWLVKLYWSLFPLSLGVFGPYLNYVLAWVALGRQPVPSADDPKFIPGIGWARDLFLGWTVLAMPVAIVVAAIPVVIAVRALDRPTARWCLTRALIPIIGLVLLIGIQGRVIRWFGD